MIYLIFLTLVFYSPSSFAYLDPGAGHYIFSAISIVLYVIFQTFSHFVTPYLKRRKIKDSPILESISKGHFVGTGQHTVNIVAFDEVNRDNPQLGPSDIILISQADLNLDWLFNFEFKGLICQFGGPNSHVAIQCHERGEIAILGVGRDTFEQLEKVNRTILLDMDNEKWHFLKD